MFYILMLVGIILIASGVFLEKRFSSSVKSILRDRAKENKKAEAPSRDMEVMFLEKRLEKLEEMLFNKLFQEEKTKQTDDLGGLELPVEGRIDEEEKIRADYLQQYRLIKKYEEENKSLDEIARLLEMNKGEVILLKSLYKNL